MRQNEQMLFMIAIVLFAYYASSSGLLAVTANCQEFSVYSHNVYPGGLVDAYAYCDDLPNSYKAAIAGCEKIYGKCTDPVLKVCAYDVYDRDNLFTGKRYMAVGDAVLVPSTIGHLEIYQIYTICEGFCTEGGNNYKYGEWIQFCDGNIIRKKTCEKGGWGQPYYAARCEEGKVCTMVEKQTRCVSENAVTSSISSSTTSSTTTSTSTSLQTTAETTERSSTSSTSTVPPGQTSTVPPGQTSIVPDTTTTVKAEKKAWVKYADGTCAERPVSEIPENVVKYVSESACLYEEIDYTMLALIMAVIIFLVIILRRR